MNLHRTLKMVDGDVCDVMVDYEIEINEDKNKSVAINRIDYWCNDTLTWNSISPTSNFYDKLIGEITSEILWG
jgi:hypothetical protein